MAIKSNIRLTEVLVEPSICINRQKAIAIINMHMGMRMREREENPHSSETREKICSF